MLMLTLRRSHFTETCSLGDEDALSREESAFLREQDLREQESLSHVSSFRLILWLRFSRDFLQSQCCALTGSSEKDLVLERCLCISCVYVLREDCQTLHCPLLKWPQDH